jgi:hypothetical protein
VDEPTEEVSPLDVGLTAGRLDGSETLGHLKGQSPMRASPVAVAHIDPKDAIEMPGADPEEARAERGRDREVEADEDGKPGCGQAEGEDQKNC